jgi:hypothetical protein
MRTTWAEGTALSRHRTAMLEATRPASARSAPATGPTRAATGEHAGVPAGGSRSARKKRGLFRRTGIVLPASGIAVLLVVVVFLASYLTNTKGSGAASIFGAIDGLGHSSSVAALEQERQNIIAMDNATQTLTIDSKPASVDPDQFEQEQSESADSGTTAVSVTLPPADPTAAEQTAESMLASYGWSGSTQWDCLYDLWEQESGWNVYAENAESGAYGIPQALPGDKMASAGANWQTSAATQITWGLGYIKSVYGTPCGAWQNEEEYGYY